MPLHPTAQQVQEPPPGPSRPPLYSPVKQSKRRGDAPPIAGPLRLDTLGLPWHRPLFPQQAKVGGGITPCFGGRTGGDLPAGRGVGAPPSGSNKGACGRLPRGEGQSRPCWGGHIPHVGRGVGGRHRPQHRNPPSLARNPRLCLLTRGSSSTTDSTGRAAEVRGGPARAGGLVHMHPLPGAPATPQNPPEPSCPRPSHPFYHPFFLEKTHPGASAPPQPPPPPLREGGRDTTPPPRSSPPPRCSGAQPPAGVGGGGGRQPDPEQGGSKQRLRGTDGWGRGKARRMRGQEGESDSPSPPQPLGARPLPPPGPGAWYLPNGPG